jgi:carbon monoxide dehydrogenase subunit G
MTFEQTVSLPADPDRVWAFVMDVPSVAKCIPGVEAVEDLGGDRYRATVRVRVGPIGLALQSEIRVVERDEATRTAAMQVEGADKRIGGAVKATMTMQLNPGPEGTSMEVKTDAQVMGRIGDFGQPVIRKKADQMLQEVGANMRAALATSPTA